MADLKPPEILETTIATGVTKSQTKSLKLLVLAILAGSFIAFGAEAANMASFNLLAKPETYGLGKVLMGAVFAGGLIMVMMAGAELFTGNVLIISAVISRKAKFFGMLRNWVIVYIGNFIGSIFIAWLMNESGLFKTSNGLLGGVTVKIAAAKVGLTFFQAFLLGIACNWLVCLAVWMSYGAKAVSGKVLAIFFPIWLFVTSGFEHSIANMYYIPAGIMAKSNQLYAKLSGDKPDELAHLTWGRFLLHNLAPVTLGNIVGGALFVGMAYLFVYSKKKEQTANPVASTPAVKAGKSKMPRK